MTKKPFDLDDLMADTFRFKTAVAGLEGFLLVPGLDHLDAATEAFQRLANELKPRLAAEERQRDIEAGRELEIDAVVEALNTEAANNGGA